MPSGDIAFLGFSEKVATNRLNGKLNLIGHSCVVDTHMFPLPLGGLWAILAFRGHPFPARIRLNHGQSDYFELIIEATESPDSDPQEWIILSMNVNEPGYVVNAPGPATWTIVNDDGTSTPIGTCSFRLVDVEPFSKEFVAAIRSDPSAAKLVRVELSCRLCLTKLSAYAGTERSDQLEKEGCVWFQDLPDDFTCSCGKFSPSLTSIRHNLHGYLRIREAQAAGLVVEPAYLPEDVRLIAASFRLLLDSDPDEEAVQKFIEVNPLLLHQFPATKFLLKPPVLTRYKADFGILTPQKQLLLIEIEKPSKAILKRNGDRSSDLNHAIDQVTDWLHFAREHRLAFLDSLGIPRDEVADVMGVVVMGRDAQNDTERLRKLKGTDHGVSFLTYDDILTSMEILASSLQRPLSKELIGFSPPKLGDNNSSLTSVEKKATDTR